MKKWLKRLPFGGILPFAILFLLIFSLSSLSAETAANTGEEAKKETSLYFIAGRTLVVNLNGYTGKEIQWIEDVISELIKAKKSSDRTAFRKIKILEIRINSEGGKVDGVLRICGLMERAKEYVVVKTVAYEEACSSAALILSAGTKGKRYVRIDSEVMIHDPTFSREKVLIDRKFLDDMREFYETNPWVNAVYEVLSKNTGQTLETIKKDCYGGKYFTAQEAIDYGLADKIW